MDWHLPWLLFFKKWILFGIKLKQDVFQELEEKILNSSISNIKKTESYFRSN